MKRSNWAKMPMKKVFRQRCHVNRALRWGGMDEGCVLPTQVLNQFSWNEAMSPGLKNFFLV